MKLWFRRCAMILSFAAVATVALSQRSAQPPTTPAEPEGRLPNGKDQKEEMLKAEHQQNLKDAAQLADLAEQLKVELEKNDRYILSLSTIKKTDDIEKLARKIRTRLRHN
jgi:hypothetical protein